jgi:D-arabinose 1-dehydrogenase-like Zn-dependent alcohol dehydrogenase
MHEYGKALILEDIPVPDIQPDEILVNVKTCAMCRSDVQLVDGYFRKYADIPTPITLGHETGLTPYRGIKKLRDAGALGPDRVLGVFGVGGLGGYAVQHAKLLGSGAKVVAFGRNADKINISCHRKGRILSISCCRSLAGQ